jgi:hypothetical protein
MPAGTRSRLSSGGPLVVADGLGTCPLADEVTFPFLAGASAVYVASMADLSVTGDRNDPLPVPRYPVRRPMVVAVSALVLVFALGVAVGYQLRARKTQPAAQQGGPVGTASIVAGGRCGMQVGTTLWLGVEVLNDGPGPVVLQSIAVRLPIGGLGQPANVMWAACGELSPVVVPFGAPVVVPFGAQQVQAGVAAAGQLTLADRGTLWVSGVFPVTVGCPTPYPMLFALTYTDATGAPNESNLGFNDLQGVTYTGCS